VEEISSGYGMGKKMPVKSRQTGVKQKKSQINAKQNLRQSSLDIAMTHNLYSDINIALLTNAKDVMHLFKS